MYVFFMIFVLISDPFSVLNSMMDLINIYDSVQKQPPRPGVGFNLGIGLIEL